MIDAVYTGFVGFGLSTDAIGLFGPVGADLRGDEFTAKFELDTSKGIPTYPIPPTENYRYGGSDYGSESSSPVIEATLTINSDTVTINSDADGSVQAFNGHAYPSVNSQIHYGQDTADNYLMLQAWDAKGSSTGNIPLTIDVPFSLIFGSADTGTGEAHFVTGSGVGRLYTTIGNLTPTSLRYEWPAVPEPSTWTIVLIGFAAVSFVGCRGRNRLASPIALSEPIYFRKLHLDS
jgi:hypothetical protein